MCTAPMLLTDKWGYLQKVNCGMCLECLKHKASEWTGRILMESFYYKYSTFATFTYSDEFLPSRGVSTDEMTHLTRRLYQRSPGLRYYGVGEYGGQFGRPHYHFILFGVNMYESPLFLNLRPDLFNKNQCRCDCPSWKYGHVVVEDACPANMSYIAGYVKSKFDLEKRKVLEAGRNPTCNTMSLKPPVGFRYMSEYKDKLLKDGCVKLGGHEYALPQYFKSNIVNLYERSSLKKVLRDKYKSIFDQDVEDLGSDRLAYQLAKDRLRVRNLENERKEFDKRCSK